MSTSTGDVKSQYENGVPSSLNFTVTTNGAVDFHVPQTPLFEAGITTNANVNDATSNGSLLVGVDSRYVDKNFYLSLKDFNVSYNSSDPKAAQTQMVVALANSFVSSIKNKWIQFDMSATADTASTTSSSLSDADSKMIRDYISGMSYITAISNVGTENIGNVSSYHLKMTVQGNQKMMDVIQKLTSNNASTNAVQPQDVSSFINQKVDLDVWIGKSDFLVYKIVTGPININNAQAKTETTSSHEIVFGNYGQPVSVTAPQGAVPLQTLIQNMLGGLGAQVTPAKVTPKPVVTTPVVVPIVTKINTGNLLTNPGAEKGTLEGWTVGGVSNPDIENGTINLKNKPYSGSYDFWGNKGASGTLSQVVSLVGNQGISSSIIDGGKLYANLSFWEESYSSATYNDTGGIILDFLNSSKNVIGSISTPALGAKSQDWQNYTHSYVIPANTRYIRYTMNFIRNQGADLDAYIDDNSLIVTSN